MKSKIIPAAAAEFGRRLSNPTGPAANPPDLLRAWHSRYPSRPVLLYHPTDPPHAATLAALAPSLGVMAWPQRPASEDHIRELAALLRRLVSRQPLHFIGALLATLRPNTAPRIQAFVAALLDRLAEGGRGAPSVSQLAAQAACVPWQLRRDCARAQLPTPQRLIEWLALIYVLALADWEGLSPTGATHRAGLDPKCVQRLRRRLMPEVPTLRGPSARDLLVQAVGEFARTVRLPPERRVLVITRLLQA